MWRWWKRHTSGEQPSVGSVYELAKYDCSRDRLQQERIVQFARKLLVRSGMCWHKGGSFRGKSKKVSGMLHIAFSYAVRKSCENLSAIRAREWMFWELLGSELTSVPLEWAGSKKPILLPPSKIKKGERRPK
ncbi:MAG: hypothetical protein U0X74_03035 [Anaerolineales bacterium]